MRRSGFTLAEVLVVMFLGSIVMFMVVWMFMPSLLMFRKEQAATEANQTSLVVLGRVSRALMNSLLETVTIGAVNADIPVALSLGEVTGFSSTSGAPVLGEAFTVYYFQRTQRQLRSFEFKPGSTSPYDLSAPEPPALSATDLAQLVLQRETSREYRVVGRNVERFELTDNDNDTSQLHPPLKVTVEIKVSLEHPEPGGRRFEINAASLRVTCRAHRW